MPGLLLILCIVALIVILLSNYYNKSNVPNIIAGNTDQVIEVPNNSWINKFVFIPDKDLIFRSKESFIGKLAGNSMKQRGLKKNDLVIGKIINSFNYEFSKNELVIIKITDNKKNSFGHLKIREFKEKINDKEIITCKFNKDTAERIESSVPHKLEDIVAVVDRYVEM